MAAGVALSVEKSLSLGISIFPAHLFAFSTVCFYSIRRVTISTKASEIAAQDILSKELCFCICHSSGFTATKRRMWAKAGVLLRKRLVI